MPRHPELKAGNLQIKVNWVAYKVGTRITGKPGNKIEFLRIFRYTKGLDGIENSFSILN